MASLNSLATGSKRPRIEASSDEESRSKVAHRSPEFDPSLCAFLRPDNPKLTNQHALIAQQVDNHSRDLHECLRRLLYTTSNMPDFPLDLWVNILLDDFVDFDAILSCHDRSNWDTRKVTISDQGHIIPIASPKPHKRVSSFTDWNLCWERYAHAVIFVYPSRIAELDTYATHITRLFNDESFGRDIKRVLDYDRMVRKLVGRDRGVLFNETARFETFKHEVYILAMNSLADNAERLIGNVNHGRNGGGRRRGVTVQPFDSLVFIVEATFF
ncbi:hypothetical protein MPER_10355 [Moniliophthora perniciosa FA553]|nr:hypothetical protein MPER_10355 [Moniliophthora perniciosa FA553]